MFKKYGNIREKQKVSLRLQNNIVSTDILEIDIQGILQTKIIFTIYDIFKIIF